MGNVILNRMNNGFAILFLSSLEKVIGKDQSNFLFTINWYG